jgi:hypothetical protein
MTADVTVLHNTSGVQFLGNDLAIAVTADAQTGRSGWAIPLDGDTVLGMFPSSGRSIATWTNNQWLTSIVHAAFPSNPNEVEKLNDAVASAAVDFIYGADRGEMTRASRALAGPSTLSESVMNAWPQSVELRRVHELEWWRLADAIGKRPGDLKRHNFQRPDFVKVQKAGWAPTPIIAGNMPEYRTGVSFVPERAELRLDLHSEPIGLDSTGRPFWHPTSRVIYAGPRDRRPDREHARQKAKRKTSATSRRRNR